MVLKSLLPEGATHTTHLIGRRLPCFYCEEPNEIVSVGEKIDARLPEKPVTQAN